MSVAMNNIDRVFEETLYDWEITWGKLGEIKGYHLQKQYDESVQLFNNYRIKRKDGFGYEVIKEFDPNNHHIDNLFELKVPLLYGYAYQIIKKNFQKKEKENRLYTLKKLIREAQKLNYKNQFTLLIFKSLNILVSFVMSKPDPKGNIWRYIIEDPVIYKYFEEINFDIISINKHIIFIKNRVSQLNTFNLANNNSPPHMHLPKIKDLTMWYYFVPYLSFEIFLYYPDTIFPLELAWSAHQDEVGIAVIGNGNCSVHGSTINNTFNMLLHDLFHWRRWVNKAKLNEPLYLDFNNELHTYLLSCITNPTTNNIDNPQDLVVFFFLVHEAFYTELEEGELFVGKFLKKNKLTKLFFGLSQEKINLVKKLTLAENFKRFIGNARKLNAIVGLEYTTKSIWLLKKLNWLLNQELYQDSSVNISNIKLVKVYCTKNKNDIIRAKFRYIVNSNIGPINSKKSKFLYGLLIISPIKNDEYNLKIKIKVTDKNTDFNALEKIILNYHYAQKNSADDYHRFLMPIYPNIFKPLPNGIQANPGVVAKGIDRLFIDFYERHKDKFIQDSK